MEKQKHWNLSLINSFFLLYGPAGVKKAGRETTMTHPTGFRCIRCKEPVQEEALQCPHCSFNPDSARTTGTAKGLVSVALQGATLGIAGRGLQESAVEELEAAREGIAEEVPEDE